MKKKIALAAVAGTLAFAMTGCSMVIDMKCDKNNNISATTTMIMTESDLTDMGMTAKDAKEQGFTEQTIDGQTCYVVSEEEEDSPASDAIMGFGSYFADGIFFADASTVDESQDMSDYENMGYSAEDMAQIMTIAISFDDSITKTNGTIKDGKANFTMDMANGAWYAYTAAGEKKIQADKKKPVVKVTKKAIYVKDNLCLASVTVNGKAADLSNVVTSGKKAGYAKIKVKKGAKIVATDIAGNKTTGQVK